MSQSHQPLPIDDFFIPSGGGGGKVVADRTLLMQRVGVGFPFSLQFMTTSHFVEFQENRFYSSFSVQWNVCYQTDVWKLIFAPVILFQKSTFYQFIKDQLVKCKLIKKNCRSEKRFLIIWREMSIFHRTEKEE